MIVQKLSSVDLFLRARPSFVAVRDALLGTSPYQDDERLSEDGDIGLAARHLLRNVEYKTKQPSQFPFETPAKFMP